MKLVTITYWLSTAILALFMGAGGIADILLVEQIVTGVTHVGFPAYVIPFFGVMKILGIITILVPQLGRLREGAYAGLLFYSIGIIYVHIGSGDGAAEIFPGIVAVALVLTSYITSLKVKGLYGAK